MFASTSGSPEFGMAAPNISRLDRFLSYGLLSAMENSGHLWSFQRKGQTDRAAQGGRGHGKGRLVTFPGKLESLPLPGQEQKSRPCQKRCLLPTFYQELPGLPQPQPQHGDGTSFPNEGLKSVWSLLDHTSE